LNPTKLSHSISVIGDNVEDVLLTPLELHGVVSCFPTFKPTQLEFETCDRYELTYESPEYDPSDTKFHDQEAGMMDSWGNIKVSGDCHPKRRQVCCLRQKEEEIKHMSSKYSGTSAKLQDLSAVLDDGKLLAELDGNHLNLNVSLVKSEMRDKGGIDAATLANKWGIGIEEVKRMRLVTTQRGIRRMVHPNFTKRYKTNERQLRYRRLPVTMYTDTMYSTILSRQMNKAAQIFTTDFGFVRTFPMKKKMRHMRLFLCYFTEMDSQMSWSWMDPRHKLKGNSRENCVMQAVISSRLNPTHNPPTWMKELCVN
jgi:hypothetical protein